jgi:malic enzyme
MRIGASLVLIAIGAILRFAVTASVAGVDLKTIGVILMGIGGVGLIISLILMSTRRRTDVITTSDAAGMPAETRTTYVRPNRLDSEP